MATRGRRALGLVCTLLWLAGCQAEPAPRFPLRTSSGRPPNVLLVTVDTLRADHLGAYGYPRPTTPTMDALAARGVRCAVAVASAPETAPATASLLTGLLQPRTGVLANPDVLPATVVTLAEQMSAAGWTTAAFVRNGLVGAEQGFGQGFGHFESVYGTAPDGATQRDGEAVDRTLAWLAQVPPGPWLVWLHLFDPHGPYQPRDVRWSAPFDADYARIGRTRLTRVGLKNLALGVIPHYQALPGLVDLGEYVRRYDGEIRETDTALATLIAGLDRLGVTNDTLVVLSADHGESLTEHDELLQHGWFLYDTTIRIPLIFAWPGTLPAGQVLPEQVRSIDLVPTLEELVGVARAADTPLDGRSLATRLLARGTASEAPAFLIGPHENHQFGIRMGGWKLVVTPGGRPWVPAGAQHAVRTTTPERHQLYDLTTDPDELIDLAPRQPERVATMAAAVASFRRACTLDVCADTPRDWKPTTAGSKTPAPVDGAVQQRLRELGYVD